MDKYLLWHQLSLVQQLNCVCNTTAKGTVQRAITTGYISAPTQMLPQEDVAIVIWGTRSPAMYHILFSFMQARKWLDAYSLTLRSGIWPCCQNPTCTKYGGPNNTQAFAEPGSRLENTQVSNARTRNVRTVVVGKRQRTSSSVLTKTGRAYWPTQQMISANGSTKITSPIWSLPTGYLSTF
jgi:hypothetical protein